MNKYTRPAMLLCGKRNKSGLSLEGGSRNADM